MNIIQLRTKISEKLRTMRKAKGWSIEEAADEAEMDKTGWQKIESGKTNPGLTTLNKMVESLGTTLYDFISEIEDEAKGIDNKANTQVNGGGKS